MLTTAPRKRGRTWRLAARNGVMRREWQPRVGPAPSIAASGTTLIGALLPIVPEETQRVTAHPHFGPCAFDRQAGTAHQILIDRHVGRIPGRSVHLDSEELVRKDDPQPHISQIRRPRPVDHPNSAGGIEFPLNSDNKKSE